MSTALEDKVSKDMFIETKEDGSETSLPLKEKMTPEELLADQKLVRLIDFKLIPFLALLYLMSFLDRSNVAIASVDGIQQDLNLVGNQYNICLLIFFVGYVAWEIPSGLLIKYLRPSRYIPTCTVAWGSIMMAMAFVQNFAGFATCRFFLGLMESPLFPGICFYLTMWYKRDELNFRLSLFFSSATLAGAFGGILGYAIGLLGGVGGLRPWSWLFLLEGAATVAVGIVAFWMIQDFPDDSNFLSPENKARVLRRLKLDHGTAGEVPFQWSHLRAAMKDYRVYCYVLLYITIATPLYGLSLFIPTIIRSLGVFSRAQSVLLSTPPFFVGFLITLTSAWFSDRIRNRGSFSICWMSLAGVGFAILLGINSREQPGVAYFALFLAVAGVSPSIPNSISWIGVNVGPTYKKAIAMGAFFTFGNSGGMIASTVYFSADAPRYTTGHGVMLALCICSVSLATFITLDARRENARRDLVYGKATRPLEFGEIGFNQEAHDEQNRLWGLEGMTDDQIGALGDRHPSFRYVP